MDNRDLDGLWTVLETAPPSAGVEVVGTRYSVGAGEVLAGIDSDRRRYLLIPMVAGEAARTDTRGRAVQIVRISHSGVHFLAFVCLTSDLHVVFTQFSRELVAAVAEAVSPAKAAVEMFDRWRALFSDAAQAGVIGEEKLAGLMGELLILEELLSHGSPDQLHYWTGPTGHQQDFRTSSLALEVKTTLVREGRIVGISSVDQLDVPAEHEAVACSPPA